ncbi:hypothetical protein WJX84_010793 [Apatococcus fuscideae]|uniref:Uncharacterized protein n=1 Tax=Apatococcus fuscideae TaxID=2026836 RepID=A0AAW1T2R9_9CHLO
MPVSFSGVRRAHSHFARHRPAACEANITSCLHLDSSRSPRGRMGSSLEKRTDKMLQALKGPKAWDRRRSNYPHLAGPLPIQLKSCKTAADQQLAACSPYARGLMSRRALDGCVLLYNR